MPQKRKVVRTQKKGSALVPKLRLVRRKHTDGKHWSTAAHAVTSLAIAFVLLIVAKGVSLALLSYSINHDAVKIGQMYGAEIQSSFPESQRQFLPAAFRQSVERAIALTPKGTDAPEIAAQKVSSIQHIIRDELWLRLTKAPPPVRAQIITLLHNTRGENELSLKIARYSSNVEAWNSQESDVLGILFVRFLGLQKVGGISK